MNLKKVISVALSGAMLFTSAVVTMTSASAATDFVISNCDELGTWQCWSGDNITCETEGASEGAGFIQCEQSGGPFAGCYFGSTDFTGISSLSFDVKGSDSTMWSTCNKEAIFLLSADYRTFDQYYDLDAGSGDEIRSYGVFAYAKDLKAIQMGSDWSTATVDINYETAGANFDITNVQSVCITCVGGYGPVLQGRRTTCFDNIKAIAGDPVRESTYSNKVMKVEVAGEGSAESHGYINLCKANFPAEGYDYSQCSLAFDVYFECVPVAGMFGLELCAGDANMRDNGAVDQYQVGVHAANSAMPYIANNEWYSRRISLADYGWITDSSTTAVLTFDSYTGNYTYYVDNLRIIDGEGNTVVSMFSDDFDSDYIGTNYSGNSDAFTITVADDPNLITVLSPEEVMSLIDALPAADSIVLANEAAVTAAKDAYDALDDTNKALVTNTAKLDAAVEKIDYLKAMAGVVIMKDFDNLDGIVDSCGHAFNGNNGYYNVTADVAHPISYIRVGANSAQEYVTSFNFNNYYQAEMLTYSDAAKNILFSAGNEFNQREYQYLAPMSIAAGWSRSTALVSAFNTDSPSQIESGMHGLDDVNLVFLTYTSDDNTVNNYSFDNLALVTKAYADLRDAAVNAFINAANEIATADNAQAALDEANALKAKADEFINVNTAEYQAAVAKLVLPTIPADATVEGSTVSFNEGVADAYYAFVGSTDIGDDWNTFVWAGKQYATINGASGYHKLYANTIANGLNVSYAGRYAVVLKDSEGTVSYKYFDVAGTLPSPYIESDVDYNAETGKYTINVSINIPVSGGMSGTIYYNYTGNNSYIYNNWYAFIINGRNYPDQNRGTKGYNAVRPESNTAVVEVSEPGYYTFVVPYLGNRAISVYVPAA